MKHQDLSALRQPLAATLQRIGAHCTAQGKTIAVAESVTAGCLQLILSTAEGAQDFFQGGMTVYNSAQKAVHLGIDPIFAEKCNGVDKKISLQLAKNICTVFRSTIGIGITGYATKVPEKGINGLFAYAVIVQDEQLLYEGRLEPASEGIEAQWAYAAAITEILDKRLGG